MRETTTNRAPADGAAAERALKTFAEQTFQDLSRFRWAEEREWYEVALFYQRRQWLNWSKQERRWKPVEQDKRNPRPMPVSNYFALTINANANRLGAELPRMNVQPRSDADEDRRAADMAEKAIPAIDKESGMRVMNALLAKHTVLWGLGVAKDVWDASRSTGVTSVPAVEVQKIGTRTCRRCGATAEAPRQSELFTAPGAQPAAPVGDEPEACTACGSQDMEKGERSELALGETMQFTRGKITTEVRPIFEVYLPRNCQNPNLARRICQRYRLLLGDAKRMFPEAAAELQADEPTDVHEVYLEALRSLVAYGQMQQQSMQSVTVTEVWFDWDELTPEAQKAVSEACGGDDGEFEKWQQLGGYVIAAGGKVMDYGPNPLDGKKPYTFYAWEMDPANVYPKGLGVDLVPLQKRLNRLDSLMELGMMTNAAGKWLWPKTQTTNPPSGVPSEVIEYDVIGDGKVAPTFVQPSPFHAACWQMREAVLADFQQLGLSTPASRGEADGEVDSFRGLAYLGAKAEEQINTQRFLYELGHQLRYEKVLTMARKWWDDPRLAKVAGPNGRYAMHCFEKQDLAGNYEVELIAGSSKPRTIAEKQQALSGLMQTGMVDAHDVTTRDFILDMANLPELDLSDERQYLKAHRDLERAKLGIPPVPNPFIHFDIFLKVWVDFILTEEFDELPPEAQQIITSTADAWSQKLSQIKTQAAASAGKPPTASINYKDLTPEGKVQLAAKEGIQLALPEVAGAPAPAPSGAGPAPAPTAAPPLQGVPGASVSPQQAEQAALAEGNSLAGVKR